MSLISRLAISLAESEAAMKQAKSASDAAQQLMQQEKAGKEEDQQKEANVSNEIKELKEGKKWILTSLMSIFKFSKLFFITYILKK